MSEAACGQQEIVTIHSLNLLGDGVLKLKPPIPPENLKLEDENREYIIVEKKGDLTMMTVSWKWSVAEQTPGPQKKEDEKEEGLLI